MVAECAVGVADGEHVDVLRLEVAVCDCNWSVDIVIFLCERNALQSSDANNLILGSSPLSLLPMAIQEFKQL